MCIDMQDEAQVNDLVVYALKNYWKLKSNILSDNSKSITLEVDAFPGYD